MHIFYHTIGLGYITVKAPCWFHNNGPLLVFVGYIKESGLTDYAHRGPIFVIFFCQMGLFKYFGRMDLLIG